MTQIATGFEFLFALALMLGIVITVHEFGHFIAAKSCGVRVLKFSIGFGSSIGFGRFRLRWERNGTEYVIAWLPLGGYVKMLGEYPGDGQGVPPGLGDPLEKKRLWQKLVILLAGPGMNLVLPVVVFAVSLAVGVTRPVSVIGSIERGSPAELAGLKAGDRVVSLDGMPISWWNDLQERIRARPGDVINLGIDRGGGVVQVSVEIGSRQGLDLFRSVKEIGWLGLQHPRQKAVIGMMSAQFPASRAGLRSGDLVTHIDEVAIEGWPEFSRAYQSLGERSEVRFDVERGKDGEKITLAMPALGNVESLGVFPAVVLVAAVEPGSVAEGAGLAPGDLIVSVDERPIGSFSTFQETVLASSGRSLEVLVARSGETRRFEVSPQLMKTDIGGNQEELYRIGIRGVNAILGGVLAVDRELNPFVAIPRAISQTADITVMFLRGLKKLIVGEISRRHIGGPIEIARQSYSAFQSGWGRFLNVLVLISINIGILNLLPIPMLDGGQALVYGVEGVKGKPLSLRTRGLLQQVGVALLILIMSFAFWNDISRHWSTFFDWVRGL